MFSQLHSASSAMRDAASTVAGSLVPSLSSCPDCGKSRMIAGPALGSCPDCGTAHRPVPATASS